LPADDLERLQADYYQQWTQLGQQLLTQQPFSFNDWRFTSANWSNPFFGYLASSYLHNASFLLQLLEMLKIEEDKRPANACAIWWSKPLPPARTAIFWRSL
jgi:polyhydroxyalkanoate synthase